MVGEHADEAGEHDRLPAPAMLQRMLADGGQDPNDLAQMVDAAAVGLTRQWWRNTKVEEWHAGHDIGALSDADVYRINTHTTAQVRDRLRAWCRRERVRTMTELAEADTDSISYMLYLMYRWMTNPNRKLIIGLTLRDVVDRTLANARAHPDCEVPPDVTTESELDEYRDEVDRRAGYLLACVEEHDPRAALYVPAIGTLAAEQWWGTPQYSKHLDVVFAALTNPQHRVWRGKGVPAPPPGTDLASVRHLMLTKPWDLPNDVCEWLVYEIREHYIHD
jgi:hypothetical protein